jgi:ketosteroid isomerase-like protein
MTNAEIALAYLAAIERGAVGPELAAFFAPDVRFHELPNLLVSAGKVSDLAALLAAAERGQKVVAGQKFVVQHVVSEADTVALEAEWTATLRVPLGKTPAGGHLRAQMGIFITFRDGRIVSQRNYDCYDLF